MTAHSFFYNKYFSYLASISLVVVIAFFLIERKIFDKGIYFFVLSGIMVLLFNFRNLKISKIEIAIIAGVALYIIVAYVLCSTSVQEDYGWYLVSKIYVKMLILIPVMFYFKYVNFDDSIIWASFLIGAIVAGILAVNEMWIFPEAQYDYPGRASGNINPNLFATVSLSLCGLAVFSFNKLTNNAFLKTIIPVVAGILGLIAAVLSGSRGIWLAIPFLLVLLVIYYGPHVSSWVKVGIVSFILVLFASLYVIPQTGISNRVDIAVKELRSYDSSEISAKARSSSTGARLEMWQAAWAAFKDNPVFGLGTGKYISYAEGLVEQGERNKGAIYTQPHNQYLSILSMRGIVGFFSFALLIGSIVYLFYTAMRSKNDDLVRFGYAGMSVCVIYLIYGLTDTPFERRSTVFFFSFICGLLVGKVLHYRNKTGQEA